MVPRAEWMPTKEKNGKWGKISFLCLVRDSLFLRCLQNEAPESYAFPWSSRGLPPDSSPSLRNPHLLDHSLLITLLKLLVFCNIL